jgi:uncharacterized protein (TIGR00255 family)
MGAFAMPKLSSMTGFAACSGVCDGVGWAWELRSVNARGLELRFRLPPGLDGLEATLRAEAVRWLTRGTVAATLRFQDVEAGGVAIDRKLLALLADEADSLAAQRPGSPRPRIELLMALPGVVRREAAETQAALTEAAAAALQAGFIDALTILVAGRQAEGARLLGVLSSALERLAALHAEAGPAAGAQAVEQKTRLDETVGRLLAEWPAMPADRLAQELAVLVSRSDVTEEIDRLASHLEAARALLAGNGPAGRQLDFLVQEFMREANTLCSKSASIELTGLGLQMKGLIEQIREQVQNIE